MSCNNMGSSKCQYYYDAQGQFVSKCDDNSLPVASTIPDVSDPSTNTNTSFVVAPLNSKPVDTSFVVAPLKSLMPYSESLRNSSVMLAKLPMVVSESGPEILSKIVSEN